MTIKRFSVLKNISISFNSNLISLILSTLVVAIVPKLIGIDQYGYFQLYALYSSYVGFFHFGWCDGIYLKYGGIEYENFDKKLMSSQFWYLTILETMITGILLFASFFLFKNDANNFVIFFAVALNLTLVIPRTLLSFLLQTSNRIKEYSVLVIVEKIFYSIFIFVALFFRIKNFFPLVLCDILAKLITLIFSVYFCKDIVFSRMTPFSTSLYESFDNVKVGLKLLIGNIASMLILGIMRLGIEKCWGIEMFGKISLAITVSSLLMIFINAVSLVLFPLIKRMDNNKMNNLYITIRDIMMLVLFVMLIAYYPIKNILLLWLPNYAISFRYMVLLFPLCIFESKTMLLINTYLKAIREEKCILYVNIITVILSAFLTKIVMFDMKNLVLAVLSIFICFAFRSVVCELYLASKLRVKVVKDVIIELLVSVLFITISWFFDDLVAFFLYLAVLVCYFLIKKECVKKIALSLKCKL